MRDPFTDYRAGVRKKFLFDSFMVHDDVKSTEGVPA
jgi:hypothetical protein